MTGVYQSGTIQIGSLQMGGNLPVRIQSMTNTDTNQIHETYEQCVRMIRAGAELVRLTCQGSREVESLGEIRKKLRSAGYSTPVVADIHFKADLALEAARVADKIRINPGNYLKGNRVDHLLPPLLAVCQEYNTAIRIGVNHGSLDESILNRWGNTPEGMVESAMPFLRECAGRGFSNVVVSMKSSSPVVMIQSVRLLAWRMKEEGMVFPIHLGVTEAGDGPEARIKSTVGSAPLLLESLGDTLRVSLTEPPEAELPVASEICDHFPRPDNLPYDPFTNLAWDPFRFQRRTAESVLGIGGGSRVKVISSHPPEAGIDPLPGEIAPHLIFYDQWDRQSAEDSPSGKILVLEKGEQSVPALKAMLHRFCQSDNKTPVLFKASYREADRDRFMIRLAGELGSLLVDGCLDAVWVENPEVGTAFVNEAVLMILQAAGSRISRTEYIACPSCGRTHFDIQARLREIREATSHLTTLKIGVMGCIVNGPGEMADAHYGYVGAGKGRISLYKGRSAVLKNLPEESAVEELINLIKREGDWVDP